MALPISEYSVIDSIVYLLFVLLDEIFSYNSAHFDAKGL